MVSLKGESGKKIMEVIMPTLSYPGVYIQEIPSGVRTITGVATSITAFIGWASKGPTDMAQRIFSWQDFERYFGGLDSRSYLGYAVSSFFANGGTDAYVIRLVKTDDATAANNAVAAAVTIDGKLTLTARSPGAWGNYYRIGIKQRADDATKFRLQVLSFVKTTDADGLGTVSESFENLSVDPGDQRYVKSVINDESLFLTADVIGTPSTPPSDHISPLLPLIGGQDGTVLSPNTGDFESLLTDSSGDVPLLNRVDLFNILCVPGETTPAVLALLEGYCRRKRAFLIADCAETATFNSLSQPAGLSGSLTGDDAINAAFYFPWLKIPDALQENRPKNAPPCGFMAGIYSRTDANRGVFKAPAGVDASLTSVIGTKEILTDMENGVLNQKGINCIRSMPVYGTVAWGARTLRGNDEIGSEWKYIPIRRLALFIEETLFRSTKWVVFEPNDEPLWSQIRLNIGAFMHNLFLQGAFQGSTPKEAYFVKCDKETTTQNDINLGIVNIVVGFAPLKPAEFVVIKIQQIAGEIQT
jgi:uncharacterized protein